MLISKSPLSFPLEGLHLYYTTEPSWSEAPILVFIGSSASNSGTNTSWRIQAHVLTPAGLQSHPRITTSPNSPLYVAVNHLPSDQQGDEIRRGLAISLLKYLLEVPEEVRKLLKAGTEHVATQRLFDEAHAATLASRMVKVENVPNVFADVQAAFAERCLSNIDLHLALPDHPVSQLDGRSEAELREMPADELEHLRYGKYAPLVRLLGTPTFLPTSRLKRAPSKPMAQNQNKTLSVEQENSINREMKELVDTEERYVTKLIELTTETFQTLRSACSQATGISNPDQLALQALFPKSLTELLKTNSKFLEDVRQSVKTAPCTPKIETSCELVAGLSSSAILEWSKVLLRWLPKFADCYSDYIRASSTFHQVLGRILMDGQSGLGRRIREVGEQKLRGSLIEPVQRLPRYSLFIDNVANILPAKHPAMQTLLQARDIVSNICSLQQSSAGKPQTVDRLRSIVASWPSNLRPQGRLISAADYIEVAPPYRLDRASANQPGHIFLLFADYLISVRKQSRTSLTAHGVMTEIDRPSREPLAAYVAAASAGQSVEPPLIFESFHVLRKVRFSEQSRGSLIYMTPIDMQAPYRGNGQSQPWTAKGDACTRVFFLLGAHEGKVCRWTEEIAKARIEGRYLEEERESNNWELRSTTMAERSLTMFTAVTQATAETTSKRQRHAAVVQLVVEPSRIGSRSAIQAGKGLHVSISEPDGSSFRLESRFFDGHTAVDEVDAAGLANVLAEKVLDLLRKQNQACTQAVATLLVSDDLRILHSLSIRTEGDDAKQRGFRPHSPVKLLSNFLSGAMSKDISTPLKQPFLATGDMPVLQPPTTKLKKSSSRRGRSEFEQDNASKVTVLSNFSADTLANPFSSVEDTFAAYVVAIQAQAGNILAETLRSRWQADELRVNEVYNALVELPSRYQLLADAPIDVLFAAFEKFLKRAWQEQLGPVVGLETLSSIHNKCGVLTPPSFESYFRTTLGEMAPQSRRAFTTMIKLLAELLEASGNDGDRGALTATFAEMLVTEGDPHLFISLLDRLIEDFDGLFDHRYVEGAIEASTLTIGSTNSTNRARSANTGSLSSNASSLRKRFALSRENSKLDHDSKLGSVWRTLSKTARGAATGEAGATKLLLTRSKSTEIDVRMLPPPRPQSQDGDHLLGAPSFENSSRPQSAHMPGTPASVTVSVDPVRTNLPRKKRRSSLSDLASLQNSPAAASTYSPLPRRVPDGATKVGTPPRTPSPVKGVPTPRSQLGQVSRSRKENSPPSARGTLAERPFNIQTDEGPDSPQKMAKKSNVPTSGIPTSGIPTLKGTVRGKGSLTLPHTPTRKNSLSPQKARVQSPQKLRQRIQSEQDAIGAVDQGLQAELAKIGEDLALLSRGNSVRSSVAALRPNSSSGGGGGGGGGGSSTIPHPGAPSSLSTGLRVLADRLSNLEKKHATILSDLTNRTTTLNRDIDATVVALHNKVKKLEDLNRQANAENELLYERFNQELAALSRSAQPGSGDGGGGDSGGGGGSSSSSSGAPLPPHPPPPLSTRAEREKVATTRLREAQEEVAKLKKENAKLTRENSALKTRGGGGGSGSSSVVNGSATSKT